MRADLPFIAHERGAREIALRLLRRTSVGALTVVEGKRTHRFGPGGSPAAMIVLNDATVWPKLLRGGRGLAEAYRDGLWDTPDLTAVFRLAARNVQTMDRAREKLRHVRGPYLRAMGAAARRTPERSRKDISAHYDLGNDLFELMLDPTLMYSCAVFESRETSLYDAQIAKLERVCSKLHLGPGDHVVEIGTGWGGFAIHAATTRGCRVTTTTISREQHALAVQRVREAGVAHLVEVRRDDYRHLTGRYDKLVSLEMIEAVGWKDFTTFFRCCSNLLEPHGTMLLQAITIDDRAYDVERFSRSFIRTHIFPGGNLPSPQVIANALGDETDLRTIGLEDLTSHYAETLRRWRGNVEAHADELDARGYDEPFRRLWRMYLAYCEAGFAECRIGLVQMVMAKPLHSTDHLGVAVAGETVPDAPVADSAAGVSPAVRCEGCG